MAVDTSHPYYKYATVVSALICIASGIVAFTGDINTSDFAFISLGISGLFFFVTVILLLVTIESVVDKLIDIYLITYWILFAVFVLLSLFVDGSFLAELFGEDCYNVNTSGGCTILGSINAMFHPASIFFWVALSLLFWLPLRLLNKKRKSKNNKGVQYSSDK